MSQLPPLLQIVDYVCGAMKTQALHACAELVGQLPTPAALGYSLVVANRTDTPRHGVDGRRA